MIAPPAHDASPDFHFLSDSSILHCFFMAALTRESTNYSRARALILMGLRCDSIQNHINLILSVRYIYIYLKSIIFNIIGVSYT